jgi:hypothetical protein
VARKDSHIKIPKGWPTPPFIMNDRTSVIGTTFIVCERTVGGWRAIGSAVAVYPYLTDFTMDDRHCALTDGRRFKPWEHNVNQLDGTPRSFKEHLAALKLFALRDGATPEAIRLLDIHEPLTEEEVSIMAAKKAEKEAPAKKPAAAKAAKADKPKKEPKATAAADTRKITVVTKECPYREGSKRAASWAALKGAKTVADYVAAGGAAKYVSRWEGEGHIKLS